MSIRLATVVAAVLFMVPARAQTPAVLTLDDAMARVAKTHPDLRLVDARGDTLRAEQEVAALRPELVAGITLENALGTGELTGFDGAELTLTLASVLERGGKLDARRVFAQTRIDALATERETRRLDLLAEVARRYLAVVGAQRQGEVAAADVAQRRRTVAAAQHRFSAGASPQSVVFTAQAALARAELDRERARQQEDAARRHLGALWGEAEPQFQVARVDPVRLPDIDDLGALKALLDRTPELAQLADERRIREARLQLARSERAADLDWQVGMRRLQATDDVAFVAGLSMPLGAARRAEPGIRAAEADLAALGIEREAKGLALYSTLAEAHGRYRVAQLEVERLRTDVLPKLEQAERAAERAYRAGATSYLEWAQLQFETTTVRRQRLDAALDAHRALIEIQRLTGQPFVATKQGNAP